MKTMRMACALGLACFLCLAAMGWAQVVQQTGAAGMTASAVTGTAPQVQGTGVPRLVKFSGVLKDLTGKPLAGPVEITFAIYKEQTDAAPLWQETQTLALDEQGRYTVLLGAMQSEGLPMELFATGGARWLGIQAPGAQAQPRVLLVSVPYALKAGDAETLSGKPVSDFVLAQQLKEQVQTEVAQQAKKQPDRGQQALAMVLGQGPTPMVTSQGQTSFTCPSGTTGDCVGVTQSGTGRALIAAANSSSEAARVQQNGTGWGLLVTTVSSTAVYGVSAATTGNGYAIRGDNASTEGRGILGFATATTGSTIGLWGNAASTGGTGVLGDATATTGYTYGLRGRSYSSSGTGILAYAIATTGTTRGLWAQVYSADGTAAVFQNMANGKVLSGLGGTGGGTEVFSVAGNGNLLSAGSLSGTQLISTLASGTPPLVVASNTLVPNLNASLLGGMPAAAFSTILAVNTPSGSGLTGGGTTGVLTLGLDTGFADGRYLRLTGGTLTGGLDGTTADFSGAVTARGAELPSTGTATASQGFDSYPLDFTASSFNKNTSVAEAKLFRWEADAQGNNSAHPSAQLRLLFGSAGATPTETGLRISADGTVTFAGGQTFPGTGTVTSVGSGTGLAGGPITTSGTLSVDHTVVTFQSDLTTEANARQTADTTLQSNISAEATARTAGDTAAISTAETASNAYTDTAVGVEAGLRAAADTAAVGTSEAYSDAALNAHKTSGDHDARYAQLAHANTYRLLGTAIPQVLGPVDNSTGVSGGFASNPLDLAASSFNSGSSTAEAETFRWQAEPLGDGTATPSASLNLLYGENTTPAETGLKINADGTITFASGQTFPGTGSGTVTSVGSGTGLTGGPITTSGSLSVDNAVVAFQTDLSAGIGTAESYTDSAVGSEATARTAADTTLQSNISAEATARSDADALRAQLHASNTYQSSPTGTVIPQILGPVDNSSGAGGFNSNPLDLAASAYNSGSSAAEAETFRWQAEAVGDSTATPSATLNLLYGQNTTPAETGLSIAGNGQITFAPGQSFPGTGAITGITTASGSGLTGGGTSGNLSLNVDESVVAFQSDLSTGITTAETFATSAANTAQTNAISTSETYASSAASTAQTNAVSTAEGYANSNFLPLTGGTLTGKVSGITANFSGYGPGVWGYNAVTASGDTGVYGSGLDYGVHGSSDSGIGVYGTGTGALGSGVLGTGYYGVYGSGSYFGVWSEGNFVATGFKSAVVPLPDDRVVLLYAVESPENWFEDFGTAELHNGVAEVTLDPTFAQTISTEAGYHVFLTPDGDCEGLFVARKTSAGFEVRELRGGKSDISFDYRIVARRKGYEKLRLLQLPADPETVQALRERTQLLSTSKPPKLIIPKAPPAPRKLEAPEPAPPGVVIPKPPERPKAPAMPPALLGQLSGKE